MKQINLILLRLLLILLYGAMFQVLAAENQVQTKYSSTKFYEIPVAVSKIKIDGILDEEAWKNAFLIKLPYEFYPGNNIPASVDTECLVTYNKSDLYVAFRCFDPEPGKISAHLMNRDDTGKFMSDDYISIEIDTLNDERNSFHFRVNPLGIQADGIFDSVSASFDYSWDGIWNAECKITDFGYLVEMVIPFTQLRFAAINGKQTWGFSAQRSYPRNVKYRFISQPFDRNTNCTQCQYSKIIGLEGISPGRNIEFDPTLSLIRTDIRPDDKLTAGPIKVKPGISAKWGITPNLIFNMTVNPDFSNVEANAAQLEINTRFALRYPEKRPFFLEGINYFSTPMEAVFTRTVYEPLWGAKLTGKIGKNTLGLFFTQDKYNTLIFPSNQESLSTSIKENILGNVVRYRLDVGKGSSIGALYSGRTRSDYYNHVMGVDTYFQLSKPKVLQFQFLHSQTKYPEDIAGDYNQKNGAFGGNAFYARLKHSERNISYSLKYQTLSPNFRADFGYMPRVDIRLYSAMLAPTIWGEKGVWFNNIIFSLSGERIDDSNNELSNQSLNAGLEYYGPLQTSIYLYYYNDKELYSGVIYKKNSFLTDFETKPWKGLALRVYGQFGDTVDYSNNRLATSFYLMGAVILSPNKYINIKASLNHERLSLHGQRIYTVNLLQTTLVYNFNVKTFVRAIFQYTHTDRNPQLYNFPVSSISKKLFTQLLFSYKLNPQTVLFIGYSDNDSGTGLRDVDMLKLNRTFFVKVGYAFGL